MAASEFPVVWIILLAIAAAVGFSFGRRKRARSFGAEGLGGANVVYVGPTAKTVTPDTLPISLSGKSVVYWMPWLPGEGHRVGITFRRADFPSTANGEPPFVNGRTNTDQPIPWSGGACFSYAINPVLKGKLPLTYKYWQSLDGGPEVDGRIIINP